MNITQLEHFYEIYRLKNMTQAAGSLYITQQGLSRSIKNLEKALEVPLFIRTSSGVIPTSYAEAIMEDVSEILNRNALLGKKLSHMKHANDSTLTIDCNRMLLDSFPHGTQEKLETVLIPNLHLIVNSCDEAAAGEHLLSGEADLAHISVPADKEQFQIFRLKDYPIVALVHPSDPLSRKAALSIRELDQRGIISFSPQWNIYHTFGDICAKFHVHPEILFEVVDALHMYFLCRENEGIGICPSFYCDYLPRTDVCILPFEEPELVWSTAIVLKKGIKLSPVIRSYINAFENMSRE